MPRPAHLLAATGLTAAALLAGASTAHAVVDPLAAGSCLLTGATEVTTVLDLAGGAPAEVPGMNCLTQP